MIKSLASVGIAWALAVAPSMASGQSASGQLKGPRTRPSAILSIEAGIVYQLGGPQPVAREEFLILRKGLASLWKEVAAKIPERIQERSWDGTPIVDLTEAEAAQKFCIGRVLVESGAFQMEGMNTPENLRMKGLAEAVAKNIVARVKTGFDGKAEFPAVSPGRYFVFGMTTLRGDMPAIWSVPATLKPGRTLLIMDGDTITYSGGDPNDSPGAPLVRDDDGDTHV